MRHATVSASTSSGAVFRSRVEGSSYEEDVEEEVRTPEPCIEPEPETSAPWLIGVTGLNYPVQTKISLSSKFNDTEFRTLQMYGQASMEAENYASLHSEDSQQKLIEDRLELDYYGNWSLSVGVAQLHAGRYILSLWSRKGEIASVTVAHEIMIAAPTNIFADSGLTAGRLVLHLRDTGITDTAKVSVLNSMQKQVWSPLAASAAILVLPQGIYRVTGGAIKIYGLMRPGQSMDVGICTGGPNTPQHRIEELRSNLSGHSRVHDVVLAPGEQAVLEFPPVGRKAQLVAWPSDEEHRTPQKQKPESKADSSLSKATPKQDIGFSKVQSDKCGAPNDSVNVRLAELEKQLAMQAEAAAREREENNRTVRLLQESLRDVKANVAELRVELAHVREQAAAERQRSEDNLSALRKQLHDQLVQNAAQRADFEAQMQAKTLSRSEPQPVQAKVVPRAKATQKRPASAAPRPKSSQKSTKAIPNKPIGGSKKTAQDQKKVREGKTKNAKDPARPEPRKRAAPGNVEGRHASTSPPKKRPARR